MLTPPQAARLLGVNADKIRAWIASGELRATNVALRHGLSRPMAILLGPDNTS